MSIILPFREHVTNNLKNIFLRILSKLIADRTSRHGKRISTCFLFSPYSLYSTHPTPPHHRLLLHVGNLNDTNMPPERCCHMNVYMHLPFGNPSMRWDSSKPRSTNGHG